MPISPNDLLFAAGGLCLERFGVATLRRAPIARGGEELKETFARAASANAGYYIDRDGLLRKAGTDVLRPEWIDVNGDGTPECYLLTEPAGTSVARQSEALNNATWEKVGTPTVTEGALVHGAISLSLVDDNDAAARERIRETLTFTGDGTKSFIVHIKAGTSGFSRIELFDATLGNVNRFDTVITWTAGVPSFNTTQGALLKSTLLSNGVYELRCQATGVVAANTNQLYLSPACGASGNDNAATGTTYFGAVAAFNALIPSSYILTTSADATRAVDKLSFLVPALQPIQAACFYWRGREMGELFTRSSNHIWKIVSGSSNPRLILRPSNVVDGFLPQLVNAAAAFAQLGYTVTGLTVGDELEILVEVILTATTMTIRGDYARNGGAVTVGSVATAVTKDATLFNNATVVLGASDTAGTSASVSAHRLLCAARGAGHTIADFRTYFGL